MTGKKNSSPETRDSRPVPPVRGTESDACFVVGIGASAGGQEALEHIFTAMPSDCGISFVVIMHIPPEGPSFLAEMLGRYTPMTVVTAEEGMALAPNTVHVIPAGWDLTVSDGRLKLEEPDSSSRAAHHPIDRLFLSLAAELRERAVAVVLSGFGLDGSMGVKGVKEAGGTVMVQEPGSAVSPAMPRSAIATGAADFVLPAEEIPVKIAEIARGTCTLPSRACATTSLDDELHAIFSSVKAATGHDFSSYKANTIMRRIERRMAVNETAGIRKYVAFLQENAQEAQALAQDILIGVTSFFRDPEAFETIRRVVIPRLFADRDPADPVRIWHACCATGEEVYSMAFLIREYLDEQRLDAKVQFFATDIDEAAIAQARAGIYPDGVEAEVGEERLRTFFTRLDGRWQVIKPVREMIVFAHHSLLKNPPFSRLDLLVCRNFLIYLTPDMQKRLITLFHQVLKPGGFLFLGSAESVGRQSDLFMSVDKKWKIFECREGGRRGETLFPFTAPVRILPGAARLQGRAETGEPSPGAMAERLLMERYSPPCVVVNEKYEVVHVSTRTNRFLEVPVGEPTRDILKMAREELRPALRAAIYKVFAEQRQVVFREVKVSLGGEDVTVNVLVEPLSAGPSSGRLAMVVFERASLPEILPGPAVRVEALPGDETSRDVLIRQLEEQLRITHEQLQVTTEQLETSQEGFLTANEELLSMNEEYQSANEELQSTNEELETSKEELQALNEELVTVNAELQAKVEELNQLNSDMENLLASSEIATLFLDRQLTIKGYTPAMTRVFNLIPADIGRPFRHLAGKIDWPTFSHDAESVLAGEPFAEREVTTLDEKLVYLKRLFPYRTTEGSIEGIVVTLIDITEMKQMEGRTRHLASFPQLNPNPVLEADLSGNLIFANPATEKILQALGMGKEDPAAFLPADLAGIIKGWDRTSDATLYREIGVNEKVFGETIFLTPQLDVVRIYVYDVTDIKRAEEALRRAKEEWERTFDSVPDLIAIMDGQHRIVRANRAMAERLGVTPEECVGQVCYHSMHGADEPHGFCPHAMTLVDGREHVAEIHEEGLGGDFLVTTTPLLDEQGTMIGTVHVARDITERKRAEEALRVSEERVRRKLDNILTPEGDIGDLDLADIIDAQSMQLLMDNFYKLTRVPMGMIDLKGEVLVGVGWQAVCTKFHRVHPEACKNCIESDTYLSAGIPQGEYKLYKCKNNMWDVATPIMVGGKHFGNFFMGQFLFEDEPLDYEYFRSQARQYGFDEKEYIAALESVPRFSKEFLDTGMAYFMELAGMLSKLSYSNIKLARSVAERDGLMDSLRKSEEQFRTLADAIPQLCWTADADGWISWYNQRWYEYTGATPEQMEGWGWQSVHDPEVLPGVIERWQGSIATGKPFDMVFPLRGADDVFRPFLTRVLPVRDQDGKVVRWFGTNTDITEQRKTEEALHHSNARLDLLAETASLLLASDSPQQIVNDLCQKVMAFLNCHAFFNFLVDEDAGCLHLNACAGIPDEEARRIEWLDYGVAVCGCAARDACRIVSEDIPNTPDPRTDLVKSYGIQAYACHPLMTQGKVIGTISFGTRTRTRFSDDDLSLMKAVADQVAIAMERKRAAEALQKAHDELDARVRERTEELAGTVETLLGEIAERERAEENVQRLNRLNAVLSGTRQAIVRAVDRETLFRDFCRIAVDEGGFLLAWVGLVNGETGRVEMVAARGSTGYLDDIRISANEEPAGEGPTGISVREGTYYICNDFLGDPGTRPWHERASTHGIRASASIALKQGGRVVGALTLYADKPDFFDRQQVELLQQMGADVSFALDNLVRETLLRESEKKFRSLFEESKDMIYLMAADGRLVDVNLAGVELFGYTREEFFTLDFATELYCDPLERERFLRILHENGFVRNFETRLQRKDGETLHVLKTASVTRDDRGEITGYRGIVHDITERKRLEQELLQAQKMESIGLLAGGVAHDFNNLMTAVTGYGQMIRENIDPGNELLTMCSEQLLGAAERAVELTRNLLAFGRKQIINPKPVPVNEIIINVAKLLTRIIGEEIEFQTNLTSTPLMVLADRGQIDQVLVNLVANARDAMPAGGKLCISTLQEQLDQRAARRCELEKPGEYAIITVADTGTGMDERTRERIFEPFFTTKEPGKGTGLGLSIIYGIVKQHNGAITVESEPGKGTTFTIYLPVVSDIVAEARKAAVLPAYGTETILLAEDDSIVRHFMEEMLKLAGFTVVAATNGEEAVSLFRQHRDKIALVVSDVVMPRKNGKEVFDEITRMAPGMKFIFTSGYTDDIIHKKGFLDETLDFLMKPVGKNDLLQKVREVLDR